MHPLTLRQRAVAAYESGKGTHEEVAVMFSISVATLCRWRTLQRTQGSVDPAPRGGGNPPRVARRDEAIVREIVESNNDFIVEEIAVAFSARTGRPCSRSAMSRALRRLGITRKKSR